MLTVFFTFITFFEIVQPTYYITTNYGKLHQFFTKIFQKYFRFVNWAAQKLKVSTGTT